MLALGQKGEEDAMRKAFVAVFRFAVLVTVLITLPHYVSDTLKASGACQTFQVTAAVPCPSCCTIPTQDEPGDPYSVGPGAYSLSYNSWSCGKALPSGCTSACSGYAYVPFLDPSCCIAEGESCSNTAQCCGNICTDGICTASIGGSPCPPADEQCGTGCCVSPILIDTDGHGFHLTNADQGVKFDIVGNGIPTQMGWTEKGGTNAFLALPGPDGLVDNGKQLFGDLTPQPQSATPNGFAALAQFDLPENGGNGDGVIDARDRIFPSLRLWIDANHDGICQKDELFTLDALGVNSISLKYRETLMVDQYGNVFRYKSRVNPDDPKESDVGRTAYDVFFVTLDTPSKSSDGGWDVRGKLR